MEFNLQDLENDPSLTPEMIDFVKACLQAEIDHRNGVFAPAEPLEVSRWDKLTEIQVPTPS